MAVPRFATPLDPTRRNNGGRVAAVGAALGTPLIPWQSYAAHLASELLPNGQYAYPVVVISVPRQAGKTTLIRADGIDRCIARRDHQVFYTAQTGKDARERWRDLVKALKVSPLRSKIDVREAAGSERVILRNLSEFRCFSPVAVALHGYTPDDVRLDEAFAHDQLRGDELMAAIVPAQQTLPHRQLWIVSTAGTADSTFLHDWIERGRAGEPGVALVDYGIGDHDDPYDPDVWRRTHPGLEGGLVGVEDIQAAADTLPPAEFERAYGNRRTRTETSIVPRERWRPLAADLESPGLGNAVLAYDVAPDDATATLLAVWRAPSGNLRAKIIAAGPGSAWLVQTVVDLAGQPRGPRAKAVAADDGGPARSITDELRRRGVTVETTGARDYATSCGAILRAIATGDLEHDGTDLFEDAATSVVTRPLGDAVAFSRRHSAGDISPMVALAVGAWVYDHAPVARPKPAIHLGR